MLDDGEIVDDGIIDIENETFLGSMRGEIVGLRYYTGEVSIVVLLSHLETMMEHLCRLLAANWFSWFENHRTNTIKTLFGWTIHLAIRSAISNAK